MGQNLALDAAAKGEFQSRVKQGQYRWATFTALYSDCLGGDHICLDI